MKVIVSGVTGFIGHEVLIQCLQNPSITSVVALSRRELPKVISENPKCKSIIMKDFKTYPEEVLHELSGANAAIWAMGVAIAPPEMDQLVNFDYPIAAVDTFAQAFAGKNEKPFRFLYVSGVLAEQDQQKSLWVGGEARRRRGRIEIEMLKRNREGFETYVARPSWVLSKGNWLVKSVTGGNSIKVDELAAAFIRTVVNGSSIHKLENATLLKEGKAYLKQVAASK